MYQVVQGNKIIFCRNAKEVALIVKCSADNIYTRLGRNGETVTVINGFEVRIKNSISYENI
jgi:hypothetical protein